MVNRLLTLLNHYNEYKPLNGENIFLFKTGRVFSGIQRKIHKFIECRQPIYKMEDCDISLEKQMYLIGGGVNVYVTDKEPNQKRTYRHIKTRSNNIFSHGMRVQKTYLLSLIHMYQLFSEDYILNSAQDVARYILSHKRKNGLYIAEAQMGLTQEEGPVTAGVIQAFCEMYGLIKDKQYLTYAAEAACSAKKYLKDSRYGYLHTLGYYENTTNVNASFAWAYTMLFAYTGQEIYKNEAENCLENVFAMQDSSGMFMYSTNNKTIYISLYHFLVVIALIKINKVFQMDLIEKNIYRALEFGETLIRNDGTVIEPEAKGRYSVFQSASRAALAFYMAGNEQLGMRITKAMSKHFLNGKAYMVITSDLKLTDENYLFRKESALIDVLEDYIQMIIIRRN